MDINISTYVAWVQLAIWLFVVIRYFWHQRQGGRIIMFKTLKEDWILAMLIIAGIVFSSYNLYTHYNISIVHFHGNPNKLIEITNQKFSQEKVLLDGHSYQYCIFDKVTFVYNGTAGYGLAHNQVIEPIRISTDNDVVSATMSLLRGLNFIKEDIPLLVGPTKEPAKNVEPLKIIK
jgi:hypothetical protein